MTTHVREAQASGCFVQVLHISDEGDMSYRQSLITHQLLRVLRFIHVSNFCHCDLEHNNILIKSDCNVKLADFGIARICT
jgi:serine/threonine protein kinase